MIIYATGDATEPQVTSDGLKIIMHCCNDKGGWGSGFVVALSKKWPQPEAVYRKRAHWPLPEECAPGYAPSPLGYPLGSVDFVLVEPDIYVANIIGQHGTFGPGNDLPVRYDALAEGFQKVAEFAALTGATVHCPRLGAGLAGGSWEVIERMLEIHLPGVTVYDLPSPEPTS